MVEGTAGNTGIGLAHICNALGYKCVIFMPDTQSKVLSSVSSSKGRWHATQNLLLLLLFLCLGAHAQARYTIVCLCLCVCVCVDCFSCSRINEVQVRASIGF